MSIVDSTGASGLLAAWRDWLLHGHWPSDWVRALPPQLPRWSGSEPPHITEQLVADPALVDWFFPADRYTSGAGRPRWDIPGLTTGQVLDLLDGGQPLGLDERLRRFYVDFLATLNASVDHHGRVRAEPSRESGGASLLQWSEVQVRAVARVLRFLHLAGWRGNGQPGEKDAFDFRYDAGFYAWLRESWTRQAKEALHPGVGSQHFAGRFPPLWSEALCRLPDDQGRWQESVHCLAGDFNFPRLVQFRDGAASPGSLQLRGVHQP